MTKSHEAFRRQIKPEVQAAARAKAAAIVAEMNLAELRKSLHLNQTEVAERMQLAQPNISKIEARPDALLSTLTQYIEALGGELELRATFPDGQEVTITQFTRRQ